ncbi:hypothetical protein AVEN_116068-1 [Araneus ventricosus]|uniref:Uncharacterized protein n=1 Tax=Araneus ventricosus TaxID=182803 RepID=A0A4Y2SXC2_ARAVE|nr:hypothetical protein AVEN_178526-1 [Araneus ventricosus]GBN91526.1 hypothetical protein AVEN_116068-1 [Araneus ventricosus]
MLFGQTLRLPCDVLFGRPSETPSSPNEYLKNLEARLESVHAFARERIKLASERMKTRYDSRILYPQDNRESAYLSANFSSTYSECPLRISLYSKDNLSFVVK